MPSLVVQSGGAAEARGIARPPTEVCITVDTEFSIAGAFAEPWRYRPLSSEMTECRVNGRSEGLGFILNALGQSGASATFFVEVLQCSYFGDGPMRRLAEEIAAANQDLQLHLHPCWVHFRSEGWRGREPENDSCAARSLDELTEMIDFGCAAFARWGLPRPTALRAGGFKFGRVIHHAMRRCGIALGSNIGLAAYRPADPELHLFSGSALIGGVLEVPALTYAAPHPLHGSQMRILAITSTSGPEMETLLWQARNAGISPVTVLTHPFEFVKRSDFRYEEMRRNHVNQRRFERLLEFIGANPRKFVTTTFARSGQAWLDAGGSRGGLLRVPPHLAFARMAHNMVNTALWSY